MLAREKIEKAMRSCERALINLDNGDMKLSLGDVNHIRAFSEAAYWLLDSEIKEEENE